MGCGDGDPCSKSGRSVLVGGYAGEDRVGLVFDSDNPCGMELSAAGINVAALRRVQLWSDCLQFTGEPGERVIVSGHVLARTEVREAGIFRSSVLNPCGVGVVSSLPRVKLAISSCSIPGEVIIDSDSQISIPAGRVTIELLLPGPNDLGTEGWEVLGSIDVPSGAAYEQAQVVVRACPPSTEWIGGVLTEWLPLDAETPGERVLVKPRRARTLALHARDNAGPPFGPASVNVEWRRTLTQSVAATTVPVNTQQTIDPWGAMPFVRVNPSATGMAQLVWGIV